MQSGAGETTAPARIWLADVATSYSRRLTPPNRPISRGNASKVRRWSRCFTNCRRSLGQTCPVVSPQKLSPFRAGGSGVDCRGASFQFGESYRSRSAGYLQATCCAFAPEFLGMAGALCKRRQTGYFCEEENCPALDGWHPGEMVQGAAGEKATSGQSWAICCTNC